MTARRDTSDDPDELVQMNVRIPRGLRDRIDVRRATKDLSRDKWVRRALEFALQSKPAAQAMTTRGGRTAPPPHTR